MLNYFRRLACVSATAAVGYGYKIKDRLLRIVENR